MPPFMLIAAADGIILVATLLIIKTQKLGYYTIIVHIAAPIKSGIMIDDILCHLCVESRRKGAS